MQYFEIQRQLRENVEDVRDFVGSLRDWHSEATGKDAALKTGKLQMTKTPTVAAPIRGEVRKEQDLAAFEEAKRQGNACFQSGDYTGALDHYTRCIELAPSQPMGYANRAFTNLKLKRYPACETDCTEALSRDPGHIKSLYRRALARRELGKLEQALADCDRALRLDAKNTPARDLREELLLRIARQKQQKQQQQPQRSQPSMWPLPPPPGMRRIPILVEEEEEEEDAPASQQPAPSAPPSSPTPPAASPSALPFPTRPTDPAASSAKAAVPPSAPSPSLPPPARNAIEFERAYKALWKPPQPEHAHLFGQYLLTLPLRSVSSLVRASLDGELVQAIVLSLDALLTAAGDEGSASSIAAPVCAFLQALAKVPRFGTTLFFLSEDDQKVLSRLLTSVQAPASLSELYLSS